MPFFTRLLLALSLIVLTADRSRAEGLVQLTLHGAIDVRGGAQVAIQWDYWAGNDTRATELQLHLAQDTTAFDVASLLVSRLRAKGATVQFPAEKSGDADHVHIFVEKTTQVNLRLGSGLWSTVTLCETGPEKVRLTKPRVNREGAQLTINTSTYLAHTKEAGSVLLELDIDERANTSSLCEMLFNQGLSKGLVCDRPTADSWRPQKGSNGGVVTGCSIEFLSPGSDWGIEIGLSVPNQ